jgi:heavy metal sensor kinase
VKLVNRVSAFFLAALATVLVIYSSVFYAVVRARLLQQFEQELRGALNSLVAAVEVEPEEVKWQPLEHTIILGAVPGQNEVQWAVIGDGSRVVEKSRNATPRLIAQAKVIASPATGSADRNQIVTSSDWDILYQRLVAPAPQRNERELDEFDEIVVVVARSYAPLNANLHRLLLLVCALPVGTWLVAVAAGHWFCRRALQPVLDMSEQARSMTGANLHSRLPVSETGDELADLAVAFNTLLDHQHRAFEQQRRFTGNAAHELRTPLTVLLGQIDVALRRTRSPQEYANTLRLLRDQTAQLQMIVESLLFLARAEEDAILPNAETFSLAAWLPDYVSRWNEHPRRGDISLKVAATDASQIKASSALLARLMDNLIENALKYSAPGSNVEVDVTTAHNDAEVLVEVKDEGCGIAAEDLVEIFNPFFRSRAARDAGIAGTGLGLAIAARIATACGGRLDCTSELGQGSRFTLRLPTVSNTLLAGNAF